MDNHLFPGAFTLFPRAFPTTARLLLEEPETEDIHVQQPADKIQLFSFNNRPMRAFHMSWMAFFLCFFAWFGIAPLMAVVRDELSLTREQVGNVVIASIAVTVLARLAIGWLCDRIGPRICYSLLLIFGSIPVMCIGFADSYESFLLFRLSIGVIGASFVITQYHTSVMFSSRCVGLANATTAGWGNLGGGVTNLLMPLVFTGLVSLGISEFWSWRLAMLGAGFLCLVTGVAYFFLTTDTPAGNFKELREKGLLVHSKRSRGSFRIAMRDPRVWVLFLVYAACFGIELTINNIAALYFVDYFGLGLAAAGVLAGLFGIMNIFARSLGGNISDRLGARGGLRGRVYWLFAALLVEGIALICFSWSTQLVAAISVLIVFSIFVQMSEGATFAIVPFINKKALGSVAGIVGAGGNVGAVAAGFLFRGSLAWNTGLMILGGAVCVVSFAALLVRFSPEVELAYRDEIAGITEGDLDEVILPVRGGVGVVES